MKAQTTSRIDRLIRLFVPLAVALSCVPLAIAQEKNQRTFRSPEEAGTGLYAAAQQEDDRPLMDILGPDAKEVISSGDPVEDMNDRVGFVVKYQQMHRLAKEPDGAMILYVGAENWPFTIPIVEKNGLWYFNTEVGKEEILARRIGQNELAALDASRQLVDAEKRFYAKPFNGEPHYAERFVSEQGKHNGLFRSGTADEFDSPLNPLIAYAGEENATAGDTSRTDRDPIPYNGYYFRILSGQGTSAEGGAKGYVVDGKMVGGFAFVAYPVEYRSSGVMAFIVDQDGIVYEKDLGPDTGKLANAITEFNPDSTWQRVN